MGSRPALRRYRSEQEGNDSLLPHYSAWSSKYSAKVTQFRKESISHFWVGRRIDATKRPFSPPTSLRSHRVAPHRAPKQIVATPSHLAARVTKVPPCPHARGDARSRRNHHAQPPTRYSLLSALDLGHDRVRDLRRVAWSRRNRTIDACTRPSRYPGRAAQNDHLGAADHRNGTTCHRVRTPDAAAVNRRTGRFSAAATALCAR